MKKNIVLFGTGYVSLRLARSLTKQGCTVWLTSRYPEKDNAIVKTGAQVLRFGSTLPEQTTHILTSVPPYEGQDPVLMNYIEELQALPSLSWCGYLSTTGVYGDHNGNWVDETTVPQPISHRTHARLSIEKQYTDVLNASIFRISGIYGPGRSAVERLQSGKVTTQADATTPVNRIHVTDIVTTLGAAISQGVTGEIFNLADDDPAPTGKVYAYAAELSGMQAQYAALPATPARPGGPMGDGSRKVRNTKIKSQLGVALRYPTYQHGMQAAWEEIQKGNS